MESHQTVGILVDSVSDLTFRLIVRIYEVTLGIDDTFTAMRAVTSEKDLWQLHTSDIHADYVGVPMANGGIGLLPWKEPFSIQ